MGPLGARKNNWGISSWRSSKVNSVNEFNSSPMRQWVRQRGQMRLSCIYHKCVSALTCCALCDPRTGCDRCAEWRLWLQRNIWESFVRACPDLLIRGGLTKVLFPNIHFIQGIHKFAFDWKHHTAVYVVAQLLNFVHFYF